MVSDTVTRPTATATPPTILVAEDDPVFRHLLKFSLTKAGFRVVAVGDGETAWQKLQAGGFTALVTDHQMPHCSGLELLGRMRASESAMEMPAAILCTAKGLEIDRERIRNEHGLLAVMGKPFSPKTLVSHLTAHCFPESVASSTANSPMDAPAKPTFVST